MAHIIWSSINVILLLYVFYLFSTFVSNRIKIFNSRYVFVAAVVLSIVAYLGLLSSNTEEEKHPQAFTENYNIEKSEELVAIVLEENISLDINLLIKYSSDQECVSIKESSSYLSGYVSGFDWEIDSVEISEKGINDNAEVFARGVLKWKILGVTLYGQNKFFQREIIL